MIENNVGLGFGGGIRENLLDLICCHVRIEDHSGRISPVVERHSSILIACLSRSVSVLVVRQSCPACRNF
jgi:hypothetical protein